MLEAPLDQRVHLEQPSFIVLENFQAGAVRALRLSPSGDDSFDVKLLVGASSRLNLDKIVVCVFVLLPELFAVLRLELCGSLTAFWAVDVQRG